MLSEHYFGDVEAIDEGKNHTSYFESTFIVPSSFSLSNLNNKRKFIILGRKGTGKTAVQFHFSRKLQETGFLTHFFSFYGDLRPTDYQDAAKTQDIDMLSIASSPGMMPNYDFRDVWRRTFLVKIAETLVQNGQQSKFTSFAIGNRKKLVSLFEGIKRSTSITLSADVRVIAAEVGIDLTKLKNNDLPLNQYAEVLTKLISTHHQNLKMYLFVDELVFSRLDSASDEVRIRAAMVRDIIRTARDLNNYFVETGLDVHIVCSLRPEVRDLINELDAEIGKILDGKCVNLDWVITEEEDSQLFQILKKKVIHSHELLGAVDFNDFVDKTITFNNRPMTIASFLATNTWGRPRDLVQLLNAIQYRNPDSQRIGEKEIKNSLAEYSRRCFIELLEEISVKHGPAIANMLRQNITRRDYPDVGAFEEQALQNAGGLNVKLLLEDLFHVGIIGGLDKSKNKPRYHWAHRGDTYLDKSIGVAIHSGLWHYLNIQ
jgi:hypothetical protein